MSTPDPGLTSIDIFAGAVLYLRNMLLNWLVLLPLLLTLPLAPIFVRTLVWAAQGSTLQCWLLVLAFLAATWVTIWSAIGLPNHRPTGGQGTVYLSEARISRLLHLPFIAWLLLMTAVALMSNPAAGPADGEVPAPVIAHALALVIGYIIAYAIQAVNQDPNRDLFWMNLPQWLIATAVSAGTVWLGILAMPMLSALYPSAKNDPITDTLLTIFFPLWLTVANLLHATIFIGLRRGGHLFDLDREWLARLNGLKLRTALLWLVFAFCAIGLPRLLLGAQSPGPSEALAYLAPILTASPVVAWLGKRAATRVRGLVEARLEKASLAQPMMLNIAALVVMAALIAALSILTQQVILGQVNWLVGQALGSGTEWADGHRLYLLIPLLATGIILALIVWGIGRVVNVNRFSMHAVYRNRLTRAFLGSPRWRDRRADPFTNFDPHDNLPIAALWQPNAPRALFPVVNMTLNISRTSRTDWAERKAMSFMVSPLFCGSAQLDKGRRDADQAPSGIFVRSEAYCGRESRSDRHRATGGLSLATAITISGAAASPNWGYNSSPATAFLMTLFNVRLGAWLPNPAVVTDPDALDRGYPDNAVRALAGDLFGMTSDRDKAIYLSDGGHFENLGIYEMFRRRCKWIVVVDAGQDRQCGFADLGNAIRKAEVDLAVRVTFDHPPRIYARDDARPAHGTPLGFAVARIDYLDQPHAYGRLLYIKPSLLADAPTAAKAYAAANAAFPHEPTSDQWFSESQFESYRALGLHQAWALVRDVHTIDGLFAEADRRYAPEQTA